MTKGEAACVSLETHFNSKIDSVSERLRSVDENAREAIRLATAAQDKRLDLLNEFRGQYTDDAKKYAMRETVESLQTQIAMIWGGLAVLSFIGIANLVKLFWVH